MSTILGGDATPAQLIGFVVALRSKGESAEELSGLLDAVLEAAELVPLSEELRASAIDIVGTGGDGSHSINVSTMAAIVVAGAGVPVCKHGARAASSKCGTADVLEALGVVVELTPNGVLQCVEQAGIGFCFAPRFHPAFRFAAPSRREIGIPTVFNLLGPMANPGRVRRQLIGVANPAYAERMLQSLRHHGSHRRLGRARQRARRTEHDRSVVGARAARRRGSNISRSTPHRSASRVAAKADLAGGEPHENATAVRRVLAGARGPHRDIVVLNAAAALVVAGHADSLAGRRRASRRRRIDSGRASDDARRLRARVAGRRRCRELTGERATCVAYSDPFAVRVPASSANLGPGFDSLGMALTLYAEVGLGDVPPGASVVDAHHPAAVAFARLGRRRHTVGAFADPDGTWARLQRCRPGRGRGGSRRAAARARLARVRRRRSARSSPRRPNSRVTPTTRPRRCSAAWWRRRAAVRSGCRSAFDPAVVVWVPAGDDVDRSLPQRSLPTVVSRDDAVHNIGHVAMLVAALAAGDTGALRDATSDRLHQELRLADAPMSRRALDAGLDAGAWCGWLSGSGPTIAMLCRPDAADGLAASLPDDGHTKVLRIDHDGAVGASSTTAPSA